MAASQKAARQSYKGHLLVASPYADGSPYRRSAVLLLEHSEQGAIGVIVDDKFRASVGRFREQLPSVNALNRGQSAAALPVNLVKWESGQLEHELKQGLWLNRIADPSPLFTSQVPDWRELVRDVGRSIYRDIGINEFPTHPALN